MGHEDRSGQHANSFPNLCDLNDLDLLHVAFEASLPRVQPFPLSESLRRTLNHLPKQLAKAPDAKCKHDPVDEIPGSTCKQSHVNKFWLLQVITTCEVAIGQYEANESCFFCAP